MSEPIHNGSNQGVRSLLSDLHKDFLELCALSTTGELTAKEWSRLSEHVAACSACRQVMEQYEQVAALAIAESAAEAQENSEINLAPDPWPIHEAEARLMESLRTRPVFPSRIYSLPKFSDWLRMRQYMVAAIVLLTCTLSGYQIGLRRGSRHIGKEAPPNLSLPRIASAPLAAAPPSESSEIRSQEDQLREEVRQDKINSARAKDQLRQIEDELAQRSADLERSVQDRDDLSRQLAQANANTQTLEARLAGIGNQSAQAAAESLALKAQAEELKVAIEAKDREIRQQQELLARDRDIRNMVSARNLYIAEIYDVGKSGGTEKPFGRVFYTKDKSLIFYGYDLDQQKGIKRDATFQAWGRQGAGQHDVSLGLLYLDDANKKRWVLKFNDPKTIAQLDAVFITIEPQGGSSRPTSKPLLFTYLRLDPNHP